MRHDFALTGRYIVLCDLPVTFSMDAVSAGKQLPYTWNPAHQSRADLDAERFGPRIGIEIHARALDSAAGALAADARSGASSAASAADFIDRAVMPASASVPVSALCA